uniref:Uncharacterized protein LOC108037942 isoform X1 n=2 Tax=Drosophila rhopaloa TaxID=1041015 RepID=A0A6P4DWQ6_DRORH
MGSCLGSSAATATAPAQTANTSTSNSSTHSTTSGSSYLTTPSPFWMANSWLGRHHKTGGRVDERERYGQQVELISSAKRTCCQRNGFIYRVLRFKRRQQCRNLLGQYCEQQSSYAKLQCECGRAMPEIQMQNLDACKLLNAQATPTRETEMGRGNVLRIFNSRASSSLDLEWEHEYSQLRQYQLQCQQTCKEPHSMPPKPRYTSLDQLAAAAAMATVQGRHVARQARFNIQLHGGPITRTSCCSSTQNSWSHTSTPESLEWDVDEEREQQRQLRLEDDNLDEGTLKLLHQIEQLKHHVLRETGDGLSVEVKAAEELTEGLQLETHVS